MLISVYGDSDSTFESYNRDGYAVYFDKQMQKKNGLDSVDDMWWAIVIRALGGSLCVNSSYSGGRVSGGYPSGCSEERCRSLHTENGRPDVILISLGYNDFGNNVPIYRRGFSLRKNTAYFYDAYDVMLDRLRQNYPDARIIYSTMTRTYIRDFPAPFPEYFRGAVFEDYNEAIRNIKRKKNCYLADVGASDVRCETLDGWHSTKLGHRAAADEWIKALKSLELIRN